MRVQSCRRWCLIATAVLVVNLSGNEASSQEKVDPKPKELRVLFLGNSLTYTNDLPRLVAALAE